MGETEGKSNIMGRMGARQEHAAGAGLGPPCARSERKGVPAGNACREKKKKNRQPARGLPEHGPLESTYHSERNMGVGVRVAARVRERGKRGAAPTTLSCIPHFSVGARV